MFVQIKDREGVISVDSAIVDLATKVGTVLLPLVSKSAEEFATQVGDPGSGKTAIASRLVQFSQGVVAPSAEFTSLTSHFLSALHFCSARDSRWVDPYVFVKSLASQLAAHYPAYATALAEESGDRQISIEVQQHIEQGQGIGVLINRLDASGVSSEDAFNRVVREPLEALFRDGFDQQVIILIDGLDEALDYNGSRNIISLLARIHELPPAVRFLLTSRRDVRVVNAFLDADELVLSAAGYEQRNQKDIRQYVKERLGSDEKLAMKAVRLDTGYITENVVETIVRKSEGNFLYTRFLLDTIAGDKRSLTELEGLPEGLDGLYFESLQRVVQLGKGDWHNEYAPLVGMLSVAQESPTFAQIQSFTEQSATKVLKCLDDLWQFVKEVESPNRGESRYRLYHQSVIDFLHSQSLSIRKKKRRNTFYLQANELHKDLADWCKRGDLSAMWEDTMLSLGELGRRTYARRFYIIHLYQAREWKRLFEVLDEGQYGKAKVRADPSMQSYALDLDLGRRAAAWEEATFQEGIFHLPFLWRYTLLRCSLRSRADQYPLAAFRLLLRLGKEREVVGLMYLLTDSSLKVRVLLELAHTLMALPQREAEGKSCFLLAWEVARTIGESSQKARTLWELAETSARHNEEQADAIWLEAEETAHSIGEGSLDGNYLKATALRELAEALTRAQREGQAEAIWQDAEEMTRSISFIGDNIFGENLIKSHALRELTEALVRAQRWERAEAVARSIGNRYQQACALGVLAEALFGAQQKDQAEAIWQEAEAMMRTIEQSNQQSEVLRVLAGGLTKAHRWEQAEAMALSIGDRSQRAWALSLLASSLVTDHQRDRAQRLCDLARGVINAIRWNQADARALRELAEALTHTQHQDLIDEVWQEAEKVALSIGENNQKPQVLQELAEALTKAHRWDQAEAVARSIGQRDQQAQALRMLGEALAQAQHWDRAEVVAHSIELNDQKAGVLRVLARALTQAQCWTQAEVIWQEAEEAVRSLEQNDQKAGMLRELAEALTQPQRWNRAEATWQEAEKVARSLEPSDRSAEMLRVLVEALTRVQRWDQAEAVARSITQGTHQAGALHTLAEALDQAEWKEQAEAIWQEAEKVARSIEENLQQAAALRELGTALTQAQRKEQAEAIWQEAEKVARSIEFPLWKANVLCTLARELTMAQQEERAEAIWQEVRVIAHPIGESTQEMVLSELVMALTQVQHWEQAEEVAYSIKDHILKDVALNELTKALAKAQCWDRLQEIARSFPLPAEVWRLRVSALLQQKNDEEALRIVQRMWLQVETKEIALPFFPLALGLVAYWPEMGSRLYAAFNWVNTFLSTV